MLTKYTCVFLVTGFVLAACEPEHEITDLDLLEELVDQIPNNFPLPNEARFSATFNSAAGYVDLSNNFFSPQGSNGRDCGSCHVAQDGWTLRPQTIALMFLLTGGTHPLFVNNLDTDRPTSDMSTVSARWASTTMLRQGKFT